MVCTVEQIVGLRLHTQGLDLVLCDEAKMKMMMYTWLFYLSVK